MNTQKIEEEIIPTHYCRKCTDIGKDDGSCVGEECSCSCHHNTQRVEEIVKDWNTIAPKYRTPEKLVELAFSQCEEELKQEIIAEIDEVYKREKGIHHWLDLRETLINKEV